MRPSVSPPIKRFLVQWPALTPEDTTWEDWDTLQSSYNLEDMVSFPREVVFTLLHQKLLKAQTHMKVVADGHRRDHEFQVGEWV